MSTLEDFKIPILFFGELCCPIKCIELSVLTLTPSYLSVTLILNLPLSISFPLTREEQAIPTFFGGKVLFIWRLLVADCFEKMLPLLTEYDGGLDLPSFALSRFTLSIVRCLSYFFTALTIKASLSANKELVGSVFSEFLSLLPLELGLL